MEHPLVRQTINDCLTEATDLAGLIKVLTALRGRIDRKVAVDTTEPSAFARGILSSEFYTFLDDAPLEERRTPGHQLPPIARHPRALTPSARSTPAPSSASAMKPGPLRIPRGVHDALLWMGFVTDAEAATWIDWLIDLGAQKARHSSRWTLVGRRWLQEPKHISSAVSKRSARFMRTTRESHCPMSPPC